MWEISVPPRIFVYNFLEKGANTYFPQSGNFGLFQQVFENFRLNKLAKEEKRLDLEDTEFGD